MGKMKSKKNKGGKKKKSHGAASNKGGNKSHVPGVSGGVGGKKKLVKGEIPLNASSIASDIVAEATAAAMLNERKVVAKERMAGETAGKTATPGSVSVTNPMPKAGTDGPKGVSSNWKLLKDTEWLEDPAMIKRARRRAEKMRKKAMNAAKNQANGDGADATAAATIADGESVKDEGTGNGNLGVTKTPMKKGKKHDKKEAAKLRHAEAAYQAYQKKLAAKQAADGAGESNDSGEKDSKARARPGSASDQGRAYGMDCEMVGVGPKGVESALARVSIVDYDERTVYDEYVLPQEPVTDYRTWVSGISEEHLQPGVAKTFQQVQEDVAKLLAGRVVVGHGLENDWASLMLSHPIHLQRDTARYAPMRRATGRPRKLVELVHMYTKRKIQDGEHSSVEDAAGTMAIYKTVEQEWEADWKKKGSKSMLPVWTPDKKKPNEALPKEDDFDFDKLLRQAAGDDE